jgi:hypothetical protein
MNHPKVLDTHSQQGQSFIPDLTISAPSHHKSFEEEAVMKICLELESLNLDKKLEQRQRPLKNEQTGTQEAARDPKLLKEGNQLQGTQKHLRC